jgi:hypothetical protein
VDEAGAMTLAKTALLGTARTSEPPVTGTPVDALIEQRADLSPEKKLLLAAGAFAIYRRAGYTPRRSAALTIDVAPDEIRPECSAGAAVVIRDMLVEFRYELLIEAFTAIAKAGWRLPSTLLTDVLDLEEMALRDAARPVLGERGRWLATKRRVWSWAGDARPVPSIDDLRRAWEEGRVEQRAAAIQSLREIDPNRAREWIAESWKTETSDARLTLVAMLAHRLSDADEEWLASMSRDRTRAVRAAIVSLLARLPRSATTARLTERADGMLEWRPAARGRSVSELIVLPPKEFEAAWDADGWSAKPPKGVGERAHWLVQALSLVNPRHWSERFGEPPIGIGRAAVATDWATPVMEGLTRAALLHDAPEWLVALWDVWLDAPAPADTQAAATRRDMLVLLFTNMSDVDAEARVARLIESAARLDIDLEAALDRFAVPWSEAVGSRVLEAIEAGASNPGSPLAPHLPSLFRAAGPALPETQLERAAALATGPAVLARALRAFDLFARQVVLRLRLYQELPR